MRHKILFVAFLLGILASMGNADASSLHSRRANQHYDSIFRTIQHNECYGFRRSCQSDIRNMLRVAQSNRNHYGQLLALMELARTEAIQNELDSAFAHMTKVKELSKGKYPKFLESYMHLAEGALYYATGQYSCAYSELDLALNGFEKLNDSVMVSKTSAYIALLYEDQGLWDKDEYYLNQAYMTGSEQMKPEIAIFKVVSKVKQKQPEEAITYLEESKRLMEKLGNGYDHLNSFNANYWISYYHLWYLILQSTGKVDSSAVYASELTKIIDRYGSDYDKANARLIEAELYRMQGPAQNAIFICRDIFQNYNGSKKADLAVSTLNVLHKTYGQMGAYADAYKTLEQLNQYQRELDERDMRVSDLLRQYELKSLATHYKQKESSIRSQTGVIVGLMVLIVSSMLFSLLLNSDRKKRQKNRNYREKLLMEKHNSASKYPEREISLDSWNDFEKQFTVDHPSFEKKVTKHNRELTETEIRICKLIKSGKGDEEIKEMLHLSDSSIRSYRSRIRKKLQVDNKKTTVEDYLKKL